MKRGAANTKGCEEEEQERGQEEKRQAGHHGLNLPALGSEISKREQLLCDQASTDVKTWQTI